jgi:hypothetical protein
LQSRSSSAWTTPSVHFCCGKFLGMGLKNYLHRLSWNRNPPNLSLQVAKITCVSHWCPAQDFFFFFW